MTRHWLLGPRAQVAGQGAYAAVALLKLSMCAQANPLDRGCLLGVPCELSFSSRKSRIQAQTIKIRNLLSNSNKGDTWASIIIVMNRTCIWFYTATIWLWLHTWSLTPSKKLGRLHLPGPLMSKSFGIPGNACLTLEWHKDNMPMFRRAPPIPHPLSLWKAGCMEELARNSWARPS